MLTLCSDQILLQILLSFKPAPVMNRYITCDYCNHAPFRTPQGLKHHLSTVLPCKELHANRKRLKPSRNFNTAILPVLLRKFRHVLDFWQM